MHYRAKLLFGQSEATSDGKTELEALKLALNDSASLRAAVGKDPSSVALVMFHVIPGQRQPQRVCYATTLDKGDLLASAIG